MQSSKNTIESFDLLKLPLLLGVILIHCSDLYPNAVLFENYTPFIRVIFSIINNFVLPICVPAFFVISGYLFFYKNTDFNMNVYKKKLNKRCYSLLLPFLLWTLIDFVYLSIKALASNGLPFDISSFPREMLTLRIFWDYTPTGFPLHAPLWYVRNLLIMMLISPLLHYILKRHISAVLSVTLFCILYFLSSSQTIWTSMVLSLFFFSVGAAFSLHRNIIQTYYFRICQFIIPLSAITIILCYLDILPHKIFTITGMAGCFMISNIIIKRTGIRIYRPLVESSFFIYCFHTFLIVALTMFILRLLIPDNSMSGLILLRYLMAPIIIYLICAAIFLALKKMCPNILSLLSGGRVSK